MMKDVLGAKFPTWQFALNVNYPIGNSIADASYARAKVEKRQTDISLRDLELQVSQQVRDSARTLLANSKRVDATKAARVLAERRLEAEEKKFAAGMSTSFEVFQAQRDLSQARSNELRAVLDYNKSQVDYETVQVAPVSGGGVSGVGGTIDDARRRGRGRRRQAPSAARSDRKDRRPGRGFSSPGPFQLPTSNSQLPTAST